MGAVSRTQCVMSLPTIVLAGDRTASHPIFGVNKALLPVAGRPLVAHVVRALADVPEVDRVIVVGPVDRVKAALANLPARADQERRIVPQGATMYANVWRGFLASLTDAAEPDSAQLEAQYPDAVAAVVTGDIPLITAADVQEFLNRANMREYDYVLGITPIEALAPYAPQQHHTGVHMAAINLAEGGFRQNNLHLIRPFRIANKHYVEEFYEARYQKEWWNAFRLIALIALKHEGTFRAVNYAVCMQLAMRAQRLGRERITAWARRRVRMADVCDAVSRLLHTRFTTLPCPTVGATLDIDNEHDLVTMSTHFREWRKRLLAETYAH